MKGKSYVNKWIGFIFLMMMVGCSSEVDEDNPILVPDLDGKPETIQLIKDNWGKLLLHCPGLSAYQSDLSFSGMEDLLGLTGEMSRAEIKFTVSGDPKKIPNSYRAWGHTCAYGIAPGGAKLRIQKSECVSLCLDQKYNGSVDYVVDM